MFNTLLLACLLISLTLGAPVQTTSSGIDPGHAQQLTVYHLNPSGVGAVPINMDTGDARGDLYFYLGEFLLPIECANASESRMKEFDCNNPERVDPDLVVTKVDMQVDSRSTAYSACNLCNGTDPITRKECQKGSYVCDCFDNFNSSSAGCDRTKLGKENITEKFVHVPASAQCASELQQLCGKVQTSKYGCGLCTKEHASRLGKSTCTRRDIEFFCPNPYNECRGSDPEAASCWRSNIPRYTGGMWYSTLAEGQCGDNDSGQCSWTVQSTRTVQEQCLKGRLMDTVEAHDTAGCFSACGPRNTTDTCWIDCFFGTMLGPEAAKSIEKPFSGMHIELIEQSWANAFLDEAKGGCRAL